MDDPDSWVGTVLPWAHPNWDPNTEGDHEDLDQYHISLLAELKEGGKKPINLSKVTEFTQEHRESPARFYERLFEAYLVYMPFDPKAPQNQQMVNVAFLPPKLF